MIRVRGLESVRSRKRASKGVIYHVKEEERRRDSSKRRRNLYDETFTYKIYGNIGTTGQLPDGPRMSLRRWHQGIRVRKLDKFVRWANSSESCLVGRAAVGRITVSRIFHLVRSRLDSTTVPRLVSVLTPSRFEEQSRRTRAGPRADKNERIIVKSRDIAGKTFFPIRYRSFAMNTRLIDDEQRGQRSKVGAVTATCPARVTRVSPGIKLIIVTRVTESRKW